MEAETISALVPCGMTGKISLKSPPRRTVFPPNRRVLALGSCKERMSLKDLSRASKACLCVIGASSHMIRAAFSINSTSIVPGVMWQVDVAFRSIGILKREWAVLPPGSSRAAIPDEATRSTIFFSDRSLEMIVWYKNVLPVPPAP